MLTSIWTESCLPTSVHYICSNMNIYLWVCVCALHPHVQYVKNNVQQRVAIKRTVWQCQHTTMLSCNTYAYSVLQIRSHEPLTECLSFNSQN